jgi:integrase
LIEKNPVMDIAFVPIPEKAPAFLTFEKLDQLLRSIKEEWFREMVAFAVTTGLRRSEITNLKWENVDFNRRVVTVVSSPSFKVKAGRRRVVPLSDLAMTVIQSCRSKHNCTEYVFTSNNHKVSEDYLTCRFKHYVRLANLDDEISFHSLRCSFASLLILRDTDIYAVSRLLGHSRVSTTEKYYAHMQTENLHGIVNKIQVTLN